ncbi:hypothetical protein L615_000100000650 [Nocardioides sp. J9]|uniref:hypothetical protein n=1 Tax=Nocardioides sp. J9 TaxID=935844 RepID=UPI0011AC1660|nr:hypothetical protein [Nocardioides sp. J9]TWH04910.1 hypothetical protein L615_000100000650 [Nocardioides sp. J9]
MDHLSTGVLYPPGSTRDLVGAVAAVAADPHRHLLGSEARSWALRRTWADAVDELLARHLAVRAGARA